MQQTTFPDFKAGRSTVGGQHQLCPGTCLVKGLPLEVNHRKSVLVQRYLEGSCEQSRKGQKLTNGMPLAVPCRNPQQHSGSASGPRLQQARQHAVYQQPTAAEGRSSCFSAFQATDATEAGRPCSTQRQAKQLRATKQMAESPQAQQLKELAAAWRTRAKDATQKLQDLDLDRPSQQVDSRSCLTCAEHSSKHERHSANSAPPSPVLVHAS